MGLLKLTTLSLTIAMMATAQDNTGRYGGHGYAMFGSGTAGGQGLMSIGVGGEGFLVKGFAFGSELGYLFPRNFSQGVGLLSLDPAYHFRRSRKHKLVPFVTAGYSLAFRQGAFNLVNYGGGVTYWFGRNLGLRLEIRDLRDTSEFAYHSTSIRLALSFR